jgi:hypothetical protein
MANLEAAKRTATATILKALSTPKHSLSNINTAS